MKKLMFKRDQGLYIKNVEKPKDLAPDEILVRVAYASICSFDIMTIRGEATQGTDGSIGHEASGIVEEIGANVSSIVAAPGDRVTLEFRLSCGLCERCRDGESQFCLNYSSKNNFMSEYVVVSEKQVYRVPDNVTLKQACLTEPVIMAMEAIRKANISNAKTLLLLGAGAMGLIILKLAKHYPLSKIVVVEPEEHKRSLAKKLGADVVIDPTQENTLTAILSDTSGHGFDAVIEASGNKKTAKTAFYMTARGGALVFFGLYGMDFEMPLNLFQLYWKDISIQAVNVPSFCFHKALRLLPKLEIDEVITGLYPFDQAVEAFKQKESGSHAKVMVQMFNVD